MAGPTETEQASIEKYLSKFSRCLSPLPRIERDEIVRETRSHLLDAVSAGAPASAATVALGDPASYARRFVENYRIDVAG